MGFVDQRVESRAFAEEYGRAHVACVLADLMTAAGIDSSELAERLNVLDAGAVSHGTARFIERVLNADCDVTITFLSRVAMVCGVRLKVSFEGHLTRGDR